jgi:hypothetical protein
MLINEKFLFISLPRCASTSFFISCLKYNLKVNHLNPLFDNQHEKIPNFSKMLNEDLADVLAHGHEPIVGLKQKFILWKNFFGLKQKFFLWKNFLKKEGGIFEKKTILDWNDHHHFQV